MHNENTNVEHREVTNRNLWTVSVHAVVGDPWHNKTLTEGDLSTELTQREDISSDRVRRLTHYRCDVLRATLLNQTFEFDIIGNIGQTRNPWT